MHIFLRLMLCTTNKKKINFKKKNLVYKVISGCIMVIVNVNSKRVCNLLRKQKVFLSKKNFFVGLQFKQFNKRKIEINRKYDCSMKLLTESLNNF